MAHAMKLSRFMRPNVFAFHYTREKWQFLTPFYENNFKISVLHRWGTANDGVICKHLVIFHDGFALR
jgi:hypothetical protein